MDEHKTAAAVIAEVKKAVVGKDDLLAKVNEMIATGE